jgi:hypothetical protein
LKSNTVLTYTLYSDDLGKNWKVMDQFNGNPVPLVMTSTKDGRFFEAYQDNLGGPVYIMYNTKGNQTAFVAPAVVDNSSSGNNLFTDTMAYMTQNWDVSQISMSRVGNSKVRIAYNALSPSGRQIIKTGIFEVFSDKEGDYKYTPTAVIKAHKVTNSAVYPMLIEPDPNLPGNASGYAALYWIESSRSNAANIDTKWEGTSAREWAAQYVVFDPENKIVAKGFLSLKDDKPRYWSEPQYQGDYYTGGFFYAENRLNFVAQWTEWDGVHGNLITVKPQ